VPPANTAIEVDDILVAQGSGTDIAHAAAFWNLAVQSAQAESDRSLVTDEIGLAEVVLPPRSTLLGKTLPELRFGTVYRLTVLGISRPGTEERLDLKESALRFGDTLLVQGPWKNIMELRKNRRDFVVMGEPENMVSAPARAKAPLALLVLVGMLILMASSVVPVVTASMMAMMAMVLTGCLTIDDAYEAIDWKSIVLIAGMLPMSTALEKVGLVSVVAQGLVSSLGNLSPLALMGGLFLLTSFFTQVLSNTATAVLVAPIALASAQALGVQPHAFLMAVAVAASMAFSMPVASPVNTLVMGSGNYRFSDFIKVGVPMVLVALVVTVLVLPWLWPM
jgi:di/tricarboxylate transporter